MITHERRCERFSRRSAYVLLASLAVALLLALGMQTAALADDGDDAPVVYTTNAAASAWDGSIDTSWYNTTDTSFTITTPAQLAGLAAITSPKSGSAEIDAAREAGDRSSRAAGIDQDDFVGKTVILGADIDLNNIRFDPISDMNNWNPDAGGQGAAISGTYKDVYWRGTFDGNGHVVRNLEVDGSVNAAKNFGGYQGLFSAIGAGGVIKNLGVTGNIYGRVNGGIVGGSNQVFHYNTSQADWPTILNCWTNVSIRSNGSSGRGSGGIFGGEDRGKYSCNIINCYARGNLTGSGNQAGGIAGPIDGAIVNCYATNSVGGSYTAALVSSLYMHGFKSGYEEPSTISCEGQLVNCYALEGNNANLYRYTDATHSSGSPVAVTTGFSTAAELKAAASKLGDAFTDDTENINGGYPILKWQAGQSIETVDASSATIEPIEDQVYNAGNELRPDVVVKLGDKTLVQGADYVVEYADNTSYGQATVTVTFIGNNVANPKTANFNIVAPASFNAEVAPVPNLWYYGQPVTPVLKVTSSDTGAALTEGTDYVIEWANNDKPGKATATVKSAVAGQEGSVSVDFWLTEAAKELKGSGTEEDPWIISDKYELQLVSHLLDVEHDTYAFGYYRVDADIDATKSTETEAAVQPIGFARTKSVLNEETGRNTTVYAHNGFGGHLDGAGHTIIYDMTDEAMSALAAITTDDGTSYKTYMGLGMIGYVRSDADHDFLVTIKDLTVAGSFTSHRGWAAAGFVQTGSSTVLEMENCVNRANITADKEEAAEGYLPKAAGFTNGSSLLHLKNCTNYGNIVSCSDGAGVATTANVPNTTQAWGLEFNQVHNKGSVNAAGAAAGLFLSIQNTLSDGVHFIECSNTGDITATANGIAAGIANTPGTSGNTMLVEYVRCFNSGSITASGTGQASGLIISAPTGAGRTVKIVDCYNVGKVSAPLCTNQYSGVSGIMASFANPSATLEINGVYNAGDIASGTNTGSILGIIRGTLNLSKGVYSISGYGLEGEISAVGTNSLTNPPNYTEKTELRSLDALKGSVADLEAMNDADEAWATDTQGINNGLPVLKWQLDEPEGFKITAQPVDATAALKQKAEFNIETNDPEAVYRWEYSVDGGETWGQSYLTGWKTSEFSFDVTAARADRLYRCKVTFSDGTVEYSDTVSVVEPKADESIKVTATPEKASAKLKDTVEFKATVEGAEDASEYTFLWYYSEDNGENWAQSYLGGWKTDAFTFAVTTPRADRIYRVKATAPSGAEIFSEPVSIELAE